VLNLKDFSYNLPDELIAKYPPEERGSTRLLALTRETGEISHRKYANLADFFEAGDVLVLNDTKVVKARIETVKKGTGGRVELVLIENHGDSDYLERFEALFLHSRRVKKGQILEIEGSEIELEVLEVLDNGIVRVGSSVKIGELIETYGKVPIPPYLNRDSKEIDRKRYQTEFARSEGSVAAPTASLNFTDEIRKSVIGKGVKIVYITLHVGLGTFLPIRSENLENHHMHEEYYEIPVESLKVIMEAKSNRKAIAALGTTVTRALEHAVSKNDLEKCLDHVKIIKDEADIFIYPGYEFKMIDKLITNFHAPGSTVLMLASAFAGWDNLKEAYEQAIQRKYDFLSYGDSMVIY
jgi:S-adenosylmethionine:tRNA ribosyltransferase-isomerase